MLRRLSLGLCGSVLMVGLLMLATTPWLSYTVNLSHSLPGHFYVVVKDARFGRDDLIAFRWHGGLGYPANAIFIKKVGGLPGDQISLNQSMIWVAGRRVGAAKFATSKGLALHAVKPGLLPQDYYFVMAPHPDSLDSRYAEVGFVHRSAIIGQAYEIF